VCACHLAIPRLSQRNHGDLGTEWAPGLPGIRRYGAGVTGGTTFRCVVEESRRKETPANLRTVLRTVFGLPERDVTQLGRILPESALHAATRPGSTQTGRDPKGASSYMRPQVLDSSEPICSALQEET
jgi:hypothetical protein